MSKVTTQTGGRSSHNRTNHNSIEVEKAVGQAPMRRRRVGVQSGVQDIAYNTSRAIGDTLSNVASGFINEVTGSSPSRLNNVSNENIHQLDQSPLPSQSPDRGGVRIPTYAEFQQQEIAKQNQFFQEQQRAAEAAAKRRIDEDRKRIEEIHSMLRKEIEKYEKAQHTMNENLEKIKKMLLLEQQQAKKGIYHITHAEVLVMMFRSFLANINESNTWLEALISRKKKRGSLFAVQSKKKGTQYSMSQELAIARSTG